MLAADGAVREMLFDPDRIVIVHRFSEAFHRYALRFGRPQARSMLQEIRVAMQPLIVRPPRRDEAAIRLPSAKAIGEALEACPNALHLIDTLLEEAEYAADYVTLFALTESDIYTALYLLLQTEHFYFGAVMHYPWNDIGSQPLDALIEVLWFRYDFDGLRDMYTNYGLLLKEQKYLIRVVYARAYSRQKDAYAQWKYGLEPYWDDEEIKALELRPEEVAQMREQFPLSNYVWHTDFGDSDRYQRAAMRLRASATGLLKLLWKTLKFAQPSPYRPPKAAGHYDRELADETTVAPFGNGQDLQGRVVLAGETVPGLAHLTHELTSSGNEAAVLRAIDLAQAELDGQSEHLIEALGEAAEAAGRTEPTQFRSVVAEFSQAVSALHTRELIQRIGLLPRTLQIVALGRLGYRHPKDIYSRSHSVYMVINGYFEGSQHRYYESVAVITETLLAPVRQEQANVRDLSEMLEIEEHGLLIEYLEQALPPELFTLAEEWVRGDRDIPREVLCDYMQTLLRLEVLLPPVLCQRIVRLQYDTPFILWPEEAERRRNERYAQQEDDAEEGEDSGWDWDSDELPF